LYGNPRSPLEYWAPLDKTFAVGLNIEPTYNKHMKRYDIEIVIPITFQVETDDISGTIKRILNSLNDEADVTFSGQVMCDEDGAAEVRDVIMNKCEYVGHKKVE
jgi:hypothetical protein